MAFGFKHSIYSAIAIALLTSTSLAGSAQAANVAVDFTKSTVAVNARAFGLDITEYQGSNGSYDPQDFQLLTNLHLQAMRIDLMMNGNNPVTGAGGSGSEPGDPWVKAVENAGAIPIIRIHIADESGDTGSQDVNDAIALVKRYTANYASTGLGSPVLYYIVANEGQGNSDNCVANPKNNSQGGEPNATCFGAFAPSMRTAAGRTIYIGGPASASFVNDQEEGYWGHTQHEADFLDYHQYGEGDGNTVTLNQLLNGGGSGGDVQQYGAASYEEEIDEVESNIGHAVPLEVGEWGPDWDANYSAMSGTSYVTWGADVLGHILKAGGISMVFGDKNNYLGAINNNDQPAPMYYAYYMFTGGKLFPHFGSTMVQASATGDENSNGSNSQFSNVSVVLNDALDVFASDNPKTIVVVNKQNNSQVVTFSLTGYASGKVDQWETTGSGLPGNGTQPNNTLSVANGTFTATVKGYAVDTFVMPGGNPGPIAWGSGTNTGGGGTVTPTPPVVSPPVVTPTPPVTTPGPSNPPVTDGEGNTWVVMNGVVYENVQGTLKPAGFSVNVISLVSQDGVIYQENNDGKWWSWNGSGWTASATAPQTASPITTTPPSQTGTSVSDGQNLWTIQNGVVYETAPGGIAKTAGFSSQVVQLVYQNGLVYQQNAFGFWWSWNGSGWTATLAPTNASTKITDAQGHKWLLQGGVVYEDGELAAFTYQVIQLLNVNGVIYQENSSNNWWSWNGKGWVATTAPATN